MCWIYFRILSLISLAFFFVACSSNEKKNEKEPIQQIDTDYIYEGDGNELTYNQQIIQNYQVFAMPLPAKLDFAGEEVPLQNVIVQEFLDREIHTNTYWHSNTFFYFKRANRWFPVIEKILKENNIPEDFKYLALIESGLLNVTSPSGANGFWQFMKQTGLDYNLEISEDVDERLNLDKATQAACEYLKTAHVKFGNWTLAAASYNMGKAGLEGQLAKQMVDNYFDLLLNIETGRYVYRILAVKCIFENPKQYGFNFRLEDLYEPYETTEIIVDSSLADLVGFAKSNGTNYKTLKILNPWLKLNKLEVKAGKTYTILLPKKSSGLDMVGQFSTKFVSND